MIRTDRARDWADTCMAQDSPMLAHEWIAHSTVEPKAPPATAFDGDVFHTPIAAHAATGHGEDYDDGQPRRQRMPEGSMVVLLPVALLAFIAAVSLLSPYFR